MSIVSPSEQQSPLLPSITVVGSSKAAACPDSAALTIAVSITDKETCSSMKRVQSTLMSLAEICQQAGVAESDCSILDSCYMEPHYVSSTFSSAATLSGWTCSRSTRVIVRDSAVLARVLDSIAARGSFDVSIVYEVQDMSVLRDKARTDAMAEARRRAVHMAAMCKGRLGPVLNIVEVEDTKNSCGSLHNYPSDAQACGLSVVATYRLLPLEEQQQQQQQQQDVDTEGASPTVAFDVVGCAKANPDVSVLRGTLATVSDNLTATQAVAAIKAEQAKVISLVGDLVPADCISFSTMPNMNRVGRKDFTASVQLCIVAVDKNHPQGGRVLGAVAERIIGVARGILLEHVVSPASKILACDASREQAVKEARRRADIYASAFDLVVDRVHTFRELVDAPELAQRILPGHSLNQQQQQFSSIASSMKKQQHIRTTPDGPDTCELATSVLFRFRPKLSS